MRARDSSWSASMRNPPYANEDGGPVGEVGTAALN